MLNEYQNKYLSKVNNFFEKYDNENCKRTYENIILN